MRVHLLNNVSFVLCRELMLLKRLKHKNVIELIDVIYNEEKEKLYPLLQRVTLIVTTVYVYNQMLASITTFRTMFLAVLGNWY